jgi:hypothetical protein
MAGYPYVVWQRIRLAIIVGLLLSVSVAVTAAQAQQLSMGVSIDEVTLEAGAVVVTGSVTCSAPTRHTDVYVDVRQPVGRLKSVSGGAYESLGPCEGELPFSLFVAPWSGAFKPGTAFISADVSSCIKGACDGATSSVVIKLKK